MNTKNLRNILSSLQTTLGVAKASKAAADIELLKNIIRGADEEAADQSVENLRQLLDAAKADLCRSYADRLRQAGIDRGKFDVAFDALSKDRAVDLRGMSEIARLYIGAIKPWRTRKAALQSIEDVFVDRAYQASKMVIVDKLKVG